MTSRRFAAAGAVDPRDVRQILAMSQPNEERNRTELAEPGVHPAELMRKRFEQWSGQPNGDVLPYLALAALVTPEAIGTDPNYYFAHGDFYPRNILAEVADTETIRITGIIDWDTAQFVPAFVAHEAPCWLWKFEEYTAGFLERPNLRIGGADIPPNVLDQEIKRAFEEEAGQDWLAIAYKKDVEVFRWFWQWIDEGLYYDTITYLAEDAIEELTGQPYEFRLRRPQIRTEIDEVGEIDDASGKDSDEKGEAVGGKQALAN